MSSVGRRAPASDDADVEMADDLENVAAVAAAADQAEIEAALPEDDDEEDETESQYMTSAHATPHHPFPHLREISPLASWHVSSHKQNCGVPALRSPSATTFWQSDGPQPHTLTIHFFKRVMIAHMRLHIDHELDESYTPTKLQIWAGCGMHDLLQVTEMVPEKPRGWLDVDLSDAGGPSEFVEGEEDPALAAAEAAAEQMRRQGGDARMLAREVAKRRKRAAVGRGPTLRAMVVQVRILENYQNGKDTHLRGVQIFAKDHGAAGRGRAFVTDERRQQAKREAQTQEHEQHMDVEDEPGPEGPVDEATLLRHRLAAEAKKVRDVDSSAGPRAVDAQGEIVPRAPPERRRRARDRNGRAVAGIREADWMGEPNLR